MKIKLTVEFKYDLNDIVDFISKDKPVAARKFKVDIELETVSVVAILKHKNSI